MRVYMYLCVYMHKCVNLGKYIYILYLQYTGGSHPLDEYSMVYAIVLRGLIIIHV